MRLCIQIWRRRFNRLFNKKESDHPMLFNELSENSRNFLLQLYQATDGDPSAQVSMYDIGSKLALDRNDASRMAEDLISMELVEIRTLAGGIGITDSALTMLEEAGVRQSQNQPESATLGDGPVVTAEGRTAVAETTAGFKQDVGKLGLSFEDLAEVMTDLKTIDTQMDSPRPKTAVIRECFRSLRSSFENAGAADAVKRIKMLLQE
jgi:hypothetical protein